MSPLSSPTRVGPARHRSHALAALASVILVSWGQPGLGAQEAPPAPAQNVLAGSRVFGEKGCGRCHAIDGLGGTAGLDLAQTTTPRSVNGFAAALWNHLPGRSAQMHAEVLQPPRFRTRGTGDLIAFLFWTNYFDPPGDPEAGRALFADRGCEPHDMADLVAYLASVQYLGQRGSAARGRAPLRQNTCLDCHSLDGAGGADGPDLARAARSSSQSAVVAALWNHVALPNVAGREARPALREQEIADFVTYFASRGGSR